MKLGSNNSQVPSVHGVKWNHRNRYGLQLATSISLGQATPPDNHWSGQSSPVSVWGEVEPRVQIWVTESLGCFCGSSLTSSEFGSQLSKVQAVYGVKLNHKYRYGLQQATGIPMGQATPPDKLGWEQSFLQGLE